MYIIRGWEPGLLQQQQRKQQQWSDSACQRHQFAMSSSYSITVARCRLTTARVGQLLPSGTHTSSENHQRGYLPQ